MTSRHKCIVAEKAGIPPPFSLPAACIQIELVKHGIATARRADHRTCPATQTFLADLAPELILVLQVHDFGQILKLNLRLEALSFVDGSGFVRLPIAPLDLAKKRIGRRDYVVSQACPNANEIGTVDVGQEQIKAVVHEVGAGRPTETVLVRDAIQPDNHGLISPGKVVAVGIAPAQDDVKDFQTMDVTGMSTENDEFFVCLFGRYLETLLGREVEHDLCGLEEIFLQR
jgi:hypothetical protein